MRRLALGICTVCLPLLAMAVEPAAEQGLSASQIVDRNVAARGGLEAWRKIQTMVWVGHIEGAKVPAARVPFALVQKRPNNTRFEMKAQNQLLLRVFDGSRGWKVRPAGNGRPELQPYSDEELSFAENGQGIDGLLMDYRSKRVTVNLEGTDEVDGRKAYRLSVKLPSGARHHVWINAATFLDVKYDSEIRNAQGLSGVSTVFYRDYKTIDGLQIPLTIESGADTGKASNRMVIDKVMLNPPLAANEFAKPNIPGMSNAVSVVVDTPQERASMLPPGSDPYRRRVR